MDKKTPNKRKSLAKTNTTPVKIQKSTGAPVSLKKKESPKTANKKQKKQLNGKQNTKKAKKKPKQIVEDETELMNESDENENSIEEAENEKLNGNSDSSDEDDESDANEPNNDKPFKKVVKSSAKDKKFGVYVGGLDYKIEESDIRKIFKNTNILSIVLLRNSFTNKSKGSGFVNFKDEVSVKKALQKNGTEFHGRKLRVNLPLDKKTRKTLLLQKLKSQVRKLEKELSETGKKNIAVKATNSANKKNKSVKMNEKNK